MLRYFFHFNLFYFVSMFALFGCDSIFSNGLPTVNGFYAVDGNRLVKIEEKADKVPKLGIHLEFILFSPTVQTEGLGNAHIIVGPTTYADRASFIVLDTAPIKDQPQMIRLIPKGRFTPGIYSARDMGKSGTGWEFEVE